MPLLRNATSLKHNAESNLGSSGASGALSCALKRKNACPASEGTRDPDHTSTWSTNIRTVRGHTRANGREEPGGRTKPHLRDASRSECSGLLASVHAVEAHTDCRARESSTTVAPAMRRAAGTVELVGHVGHRVPVIRILRVAHPPAHPSAKTIPMRGGNRVMGPHPKCPH